MTTETMKRGHTPGPWSFDGHGINCSDEYHTRICKVHGKTILNAEFEANSLLIAAAPDLLAALRDARIALTFYREDMLRAAAPGTRDYPFGIDAENNARAAIAKAQGGAA